MRFGLSPRKECVVVFVVIPWPCSLLWFLFVCRTAAMLQRIIALLQKWTVQDIPSAFVQRICTRTKYDGERNGKRSQETTWKESEHKLRFNFFFSSLLRYCRYRQWLPLDWFWNLFHASSLGRSRSHGGLHEHYFLRCNNCIFPK